MKKPISTDALISAHEALQKQIEEIESRLRKYIKFPFFVMYQHSDGFVIVHDETTENAMLRWCVGHINEHSKLTYEDYKKFTI